MASEWVIDEMRRRLDTLERLEPAVQKQRIDDLRDDVTDLKNEMRSVRRALYTMGASVLTASILFAVTMFASGFGHA